MANPEHLDILRRGVEEWNTWRKERPSVTPNLHGAELGGWVLSKVDFCETVLEGAFLFEAYLSEAKLIGANLTEARLDKATLNRADLCEARLNGANLHNTKFREAKLNNAQFRFANLTAADLCDAQLSQADLRGAILNASDLRGTSLNNAIFDYTILGDNDLSQVIGLDSIRHYGYSIIGIPSLYRSGGNIPEIFLRGCGVPENFIVLAQSLVNKPFEFRSCFICHSSRDSAFAQRIYSDLLSNGVQCYYAPESLKIGDRFRIKIDEAIQAHDRLLLILSADSVTSQWVEKEVETAMERECEEGSDATVLFPIKIDDAIETEKSGWAAGIRRTRHIGDFRWWEDDARYQKAFERLLRDLRAI